MNRRRRTFRAEGPGFLWMSQDNVLNAMNGSGASRDFGRKNGRWRTEDQQAAKHKCLVSGRFLSLTRITGHASTADEGLLSADAPEPVQRPLRCNARQSAHGQCDRQAWVGFALSATWAGRRVKVAQQTSKLRGPAIELYSRRWGHASWHPGSATTRRSRAAHFGPSTAAAEAHSLRAGCR